MVVVDGSITQVILVLDGSAAVLVILVLMVWMMFVVFVVKD